MQSVSALRLKNCREWQRNIALSGLFAGIFSALVGTLATLIFRSKFASVLHIQPGILVGYMTSNMVAQTTTMTGVPFCNVAGGDIDLQEIRFLNNGATAGDGECSMKWFDKGKYVIADWADPLSDGVSVGWGYPAGHDQEYEPVPKTFAAGEWFLLIPDSSVKKPSVQVAGAIVSTDTESPTYTITLPAEAMTATGNPFPVDCDITSIIAMNGSNIAGDGEYSMKWYDKGKYVIADWADPLSDGYSVGWGYPPGHDQEYEPVPKNFLPGQGFIITPDTSIKKPSLKVPNPLYIAE